jgi:hypothetical protein
MHIRAFSLRVGSDARGVLDDGTSGAAFGM